MRIVFNIPNTKDIKCYDCDHSWLDHWLKYTGNQQACCSAVYTNQCDGNIVGAHIREGLHTGAPIGIVPLCKAHYNFSPKEEIAIRKIYWLPVNFDLRPECEFKYMMKG